MKLRILFLISCSAGLANQCPYKFLTTVTGPAIIFDKDHFGEIRALAFDAEGTLAAGSDGGTVQIWGPPLGTPRPTINLGAISVPIQSGRTEPVKSISFSQDGKLLAVGTMSGVVAAVNLTTNNIRILYHPSSESHEGVALSPNTPLVQVALSSSGRYLAVAYQEGRINLHDLGATASAAPEMVRLNIPVYEWSQYGLVRNRIHSINFRPDEKELMVWVRGLVPIAGGGFVERLQRFYWYSLKGMRVSSRVGEPWEPRLSDAFSYFSDGELVFKFYTDGRARILETGASPFERQFFSSRFLAAGYFTNRPVIALEKWLSDDHQKQLQMCDVVTGECFTLAQFDAANTVTVAAISSNGLVMAAAIEGYPLVLWNTGSLFIGPPQASESRRQ